MKIKVSGEVKDYLTSPVIGNQLTLSVQDNIAEQLDDLNGKPVEITIRPLSETQGRSKNANAYMWALLTELQNAGFGNAVTLYKRYIRENGVSVASELPERAFRTFEYSFTHLGEGFQIERTGHDTAIGETGQEIPMITFIQYYGSHVYNKRQMHQLLDTIIQDCKAVGIQTETPEELARMLEEWN